MQNRLVQFLGLHKVGSWYARYERPISALSLVGGFIFNAVALTRVDAFWENFWIVMHLVFIAVCIVLVHRQENEVQTASAHDPSELHFWLINVMQFFFGGLLSTFIVFYFRSAALTVSWPFFVILAAAFLANESLKRHYSRLSFQIGFLFLCTFLFTIYFVPVLVHKIGPFEFLLSGAVSLGLILLFLLVLRFFAREGRKPQARAILFSTVAGVYIVVNALYFLQLIPPLPLALQDAGIFHSVTRSADGNYVVAAEETTGIVQTIKRYFNEYGDFHTTQGAPVVAYSAIFSPIAFNTSILHTWQYYDESSRTWKTYRTVSLPVVGGRERGFRTYSILTGLASGKWRVTITTQSGLVIGRLGFTVVQTDALPILVEKTRT